MTAEVTPLLLRQAGYRALAKMKAKLKKEQRLRRRIQADNRRLRQVIATLVSEQPPSNDDPEFP